MSYVPYDTEYGMIHDTVYVYEASYIIYYRVSYQNTKTCSPLFSFSFSLSLSLSLLSTVSYSVQYVHTGPG